MESEVAVVNSPTIETVCTYKKKILKKPYSPLNTHYKSQPSLTGNIKIALVLGLSDQPDFITLFQPVLLHVLLSPLEDFLPLLDVLTLLFDLRLEPFGPGCRPPLTVLQYRLWYCRQPLYRLRFLFGPKSVRKTPINLSTKPGYQM